MQKLILLLLILFITFSCKFEKETGIKPQVISEKKLPETSFKMYLKNKSWVEAENIANKYLKEGEIKNNKATLAEAYYYLGLLASSKDKDNKAALINYLTAYRLGKDISSQARLGDLLNKIASIYYLNYQYDKALVNYLNALNYFEKTKNLKNIAACLRNIAITYELKKDYNNSFIYHQKSFNIYENLNLQDFIAISYQDLGDISVKMNKNEQSLYYYKKALEIVKKYDFEIHIGIIYNNLGNVCRLQNNYPEAKNYLEKALSLQSEDPEIEATAKRNLGYVYLQEKNYNTAEGYLLKSEVVAKEADLKEDLLESYKYLSTLYKATNNYQKVALYTEKYAALNSELLQAEKLGLQASLSQISEAETKATSFISSYATTPANAPLPYLIGLAALIIVVVNMLYFYAKKSKKATHLASSLATQTHHTVEVEKNASQMMQEYTRKFQEFEQTGISLKNNLSEKDEKIMLLMQEKTSLEQSKLALEEGLSALTNRIKALEEKAEKNEQEKEKVANQLAQTEAEYTAALYYMKQENDKLLYCMKQIEDNNNKDS